MTGRMDAAPPSRRLVLLTRLALYPLAIALIALWWHQRHAGAAVRSRAAVTTLRGTTGQGLGMTAWSLDGALAGYQTKIRLTCPGNHPELDGMWVSYSEPIDLGRLHGRTTSGTTTGVPFTWKSGMHGLGTVRFAATREGAAFHGLLRLDLDIAATSGAAVPCRSGPVGFVLRRAAP